MKRHKQSKVELLEKLGAVDTNWKDEFTISFLDFLAQLPESDELTRDTIIKILENDFNNGILFFRLIHEQSKDEFNITLRKIFLDFSKGPGKNSFRLDPSKYVDKLIENGLADSFKHTIKKNYTWKDILLERLKGGRGSAIKGQTRGRNLEDFVERYVKEVYHTYASKVSFIGKDGKKKAKADFCIPSVSQPSVIIEVKAYGATGSKQSDVIGDIEKIIKEKRTDTYFLLVTDGVTWISRMSDFERLIKFQNEGEIYRIYTQKMELELAADLLQLKNELNISI
jgi:hypothetical protein